MLNAKLGSTYGVPRHAGRVSAFPVLLRMRWQIAKNCFAAPTPDRKLRWILLSALGIVFIWCDYAFFYRIIRYLDELPLQVGEELIGQLLNVVFLTLMVMGLFSSLIVSLSVFYMGRDLNLLHAMPVPTGSVIHLRLLQTVVNSSWMVFLFSMPIFIAYGYYFQVAAGYYLYLVLAFLPFVTIPCLLGVLAIMAMMRYFPTRKAHQILSFLGLICLVGLVVYIRFLSPEKFFGKEVSDAMIIQFVERLRAPDYGFLPSTWITTGLMSWVQGNVADAWIRLGYLAGITGFLFAMLRWVSGKIYYDSWRRVQEVRSAPGENNGKQSLQWLQRLPMRPGARALLIKDLRVFTRDPEQWSQVFILCALVFVYIFNIMNLPLDNLLLKNVVSVFNIGLVGFVLSALILRFVFSSPSIEGQKMWTIYTAPVDMRKFLMGKFWMFLPPLLLLSEFLVIVSNHLLEVDPYVMNVSIVGVFLITLGLVGLGLGLGAMYPVFDHENVSEIATGTGGILFMILSLGFVGLVLMIAARPMYVHFNERFLFKAIGGIDVPVCYALVVILTLVVAIVPLQRGVRALRTMDI